MTSPQKIPKKPRKPAQNLKINEIFFGGKEAPKVARVGGGPLFWSSRGGGSVITGYGIKKNYDQSLICSIGNTVRMLFCRLPASLWFPLWRWLLSAHEQPLQRRQGLRQWRRWGQLRRLQGAPSTRAPVTGPASITSRDVTATGIVPDGSDEYLCEGETWT